MKFLHALEDRVGWGWLSFSPNSKSQPGMGQGAGPRLRPCLISSLYFTDEETKTKKGM